MTLEVRVEGIDLLFLGDGCLEMSLNCSERALQIVVLLSELVEQALLKRGCMLVGLAHCHVLLGIVMLLIHVIY